MEQKMLLINSMQKLINHIVISRKNQQQIFASLSKNDFKKIISNLEDENQRLRKISLLLISQLLHNNSALKQKFCNVMSIPTVPGRVALNTKLCASGSRARNTVTVDMSKNIKEVYTLLKQPLAENQKPSLFWFINFDSKHPSPLKLQYLTSSQPQAVQIHQILDPIDSMVGFIILQKGNFKKSQSMTPQAVVEPRRKSQYEVTSSNRLVNNYFKPSGYKYQGFKPSTHGSTINQSLNMTPGYSTDREPGQSKTFHGGVKGLNTTINQDPTYKYTNKYSQNTVSPPLNQIKNNTIDSEVPGRGKFGGGIKLISSGGSATKGKHFQQNPLFHGPVSNSGHRAVSYLNGGNSIGNKGISTRVERGYETLRQKKIIEKYPAQ